jgi:hypothetical protein
VQKGMAEWLEWEKACPEFKPQYLKNAKEN